MSSETDAIYHGGVFVDIYHVPSGQNVYFKPFLTSFEDDYDPSWNEETVYGRNDPLLTFENTRRQISIGWDMPAEGPEEAQQNWGKISKLIQFLYPSYNTDRGDNFNRVSTATSLSAGPLLKMRFINFVHDVSVDSADLQSLDGLEGTPSIARESGLLGKINGFTNSIDVEQGFLPLENRIYPKLINVQFDFLTNHMHPLGWEGQNPRKRNFPYGESPGDFPDEAQRRKGGEGATNEQRESKENEVLGGSPAPNRMLSG